MRVALFAIATLVACSGDPPSEPAASRASPPAEAVGEAEPSEAPPLAAAGDEPVDAPLLVGETDGEVPAVGRREGETEGLPPPPPGETPPPVTEAQPAAPDAAGGEVLDPNLDPEHLDRVRDADMTEREKRAARARAARKAYEQ